MMYQMKHDLPMEENVQLEQPTEIFSIWNIVFLIFTTLLMYVLVRACRGDLPYVLNEKSPLNVQLMFTVRKCYVFYF